MNISKTLEDLLKSGLTYWVLRNIVKLLHRFDNSKYWSYSFLIPLNANSHVVAKFFNQLNLLEGLTQLAYASVEIYLTVSFPNSICITEFVDLLSDFTN